jgi:hypothetical protein
VKCSSVVETSGVSEGMNTSDPPVDVEVYVHAAGTSVWNDQARLVGRVEEFADRGVVESVTVGVWPRRVCAEGGLDGTRFHESAVERIERFVAWADRTGVTLPFDRRVVASRFTRAEHEVVDTPAVCVAGTADGSLLGVFPHRHGGTACSVDDLVERLDREGAGALECQPDPRSSFASPSARSTDGA